MNSAEFCQLLGIKGIDFYTGVPCSLLGGIIDALEKDGQEGYVPAVREDAAVGLAVGAYLAGKTPIVLMQNSGLGVCLNALTSLAMIYRIPLLMLITWRGYQGRDEPEHDVMGRAMLGLLEDIGMSYVVLEPEGIPTGVDEAWAISRATRLPVAMILRKGVLA